MSDLNNLKPLFSQDKLNANITHEQIKVFFDSFQKDFVTNSFSVNGKRIRIDTKPPKIKQFSAYSETFFHLITREIKSQRHRFYECERANRIHWIKPILLSNPCKDILYYKWKDENGICKEHYWFFAKDFMVVLKGVNADVQIVTSFCIDADEKLKFFERYANYRGGKEIC